MPSLEPPFASAVKDSIIKVLDADPCLSEEITESEFLKDGILLRNTDMSTREVLGILSPILKNKKER